MFLAVLAQWQAHVSNWLLIANQRKEWGKSQGHSRNAIFVLFMKRSWNFVLFVFHWESHSYIHIYVCPNCVVSMHLCECISVYLHVWLYMYVWRCICLCLNVFAWVCGHYVWVCTCLCLQWVCLTCVWVYICVCIFICVCDCVYMCVLCVLCVCMCVWARAHTAAIQSWPWVCKAGQWGVLFSLVILPASSRRPSLLPLGDEELSRGQVTCSRSHSKSGQLCEGLIARLTPPCEAELPLCGMLASRPGLAARLWELPLWATSGCVP